MMTYGGTGVIDLNLGTGWSSAGLCSQAALPLGNEPSVLTGSEAGYAPESIWTL
jgi:hypothetical protein